MAKSQPEWIALNALTLDDRMQMRADHVDSSEYQELLSQHKASEWPFETPVKAAYVIDPDDEQEKLFVVSGFTRCDAALAIGRRKVFVEIVKAESFDDAVLLAAGQNAAHGYRRTAEDVCKVVTKVREMGNSIKKTSEICRVSRATVIKYTSKPKPKPEPAKGKTLSEVFEEEDVEVTEYLPDGEEVVEEVEAVAPLQKEPKKVDKRRAVINRAVNAMSELIDALEDVEELDGYMNKKFSAVNVMIQKLYHERALKGK
jgi:hypothetical protein